MLSVQLSFMRFSCFVLILDIVIHLSGIAPLIPEILFGSMSSVEFVIWFKLKL